MLSRVFALALNLAVLTHSNPIVLEPLGEIAIAVARLAGRLPGTGLWAALFLAATLTLAAEEAAGLHLK